MDESFLQSGGCIVKINKKSITKTTIQGKSILHFTSSELLNKTIDVLKNNSKFQIDNYKCIS